MTSKATASRNGSSPVSEGWGPETEKRFGGRGRTEPLAPWAAIGIVMFTLAVCVEFRRAIGSASEEAIRQALAEGWRNR